MSLALRLLTLYAQRLMCSNEVCALEVYDKSHSSLTEKRFNIIGMSEAGVLFVVFCERDAENEEVIRISVRKATKIEKDGYERGI